MRGFETLLPCCMICMAEGRHYAECGTRVLSIQGPPGGRVPGVPPRIRELATSSVESHTAEIAYMMDKASSGSSESCHPATRAAFEYHRSCPATTVFDDQFPRADSDVSWATAGSYLYAVIHSCHALTPMMRFEMSNAPLDSIYIIVCNSHTVSRLLQYHHRGHQYSFYRCTCDRRSHHSVRSLLAAKHTRLTNGDTCFIRCTSMLHRSDSNSYPPSFLHSTISVWQPEPYVS